MAEEFGESVRPVGESAPVSPSGSQGAPAPEPRLGRSIAGRIVDVHRKNLHHGGEHQLDVSVGAESFTEIVLRVPDGNYADIEGKRGVLYIDD